MTIKKEIKLLFFVVFDWLKYLAYASYGVYSLVDIIMNKDFGVVNILGLVLLSLLVISLFLKFYKERLYKELNIKVGEVR